MNHVTFKVLNVNDAGSASEFGADDLDKIAKILNGDAEVDTVFVKSSWTFRDSKCFFSNPAESNTYKIKAAAIAANYDLTLPLITGSDTLLSANSTIEMTNKIFDSKLNTTKNFILMPSEKKWGIVMCGQIAETGSGFFDGYTKVTTPTITVDGDGQRFNFSTGSTINTPSGIKTTNIFTQRGLNPRIKARVSVANKTSTRIYFGFSSAASLPLTDDPIGSSEQGFIICYRDGVDADWRIKNNDGTGGAPGSTFTGVNVSDGTRYELEITANQQVPLFNWNIYNTTGVSVASGNISSRIPTGSTDLYMHCMIQNKAAIDRTLRIFFIEGEMDNYSV